MPLSYRRGPGRRRATLAAALLAPALVLTTLAGGAAAAPAPEPLAAEAVVSYQVRAIGVDASALAADLLAAGYDVAGRGGDVLYVLGTAATAAELTARSDVSLVRSEVIAPVVSAAPDQDDILPDKLDGNTYETFYGGYRTVDAFQQFEEDLAAAYPNLVRLVEYGESYTGANPLRAVCVTTNADQNCGLEPETGKVRFLLMAQIHARELTTSEVAWRLLTYLIDEKGKSADITALLNDSEIWIVPQTNPDGIETVETGIDQGGFGFFSNAWQRKNLNPGTVSCGTGDNSQIGVDLNRNWDSSWGGPGASPFPCDLVYRGTAAASEPETHELAALFQDLFLDQRGPGPKDAAPPGTVGAMITLHTYSNLVLFPYGAGADAPNDAGLRSMAFRMSHYNGYQTGRPNEILYEVTGSTDDWTYDDLGIASFTYEIGPGFGTCSGFHPKYTCQDEFWELNREAILYGATAAPKPYVHSLGPTIVEASSVLVGDTVEITATADDNAYGTVGVDRPAAQNVVDARLFINKAPWEGGKAKPVTVVGTGQQVELTASLAAKEKRKKVYLQAKDAAGNWGAVEVVWRSPAA